MFTLRQNSLFTLGKIRCSRFAKFCVHGWQKYAYKNALNCSDIILNLDSAISINNCFDKKYTKKLYNILEEGRSEIVEKCYFNYMHDLCIFDENYTEAFLFLDKSFKAGYSKKLYYSERSYILLLSEKYQELVDLGLNRRDEILEIDSTTFTINYQYAAKMLEHETYDSALLMNISAKGSSKEKDPDTRLGAFAVLDRMQEVKGFLVKG